jgi:hypothetical protein
MTVTGTGLASDTSTLSTCMLALQFKLSWYNCVAVASVVELDSATCTSREGKPFCSKISNMLG